MRILQAKCRIGIAQIICNIKPNSPMSPATSLWHNRYPLEKRGMASKRNPIAKTGHASTFEHCGYSGLLDLTGLLE
jgi:hypothetical protein